MSLKHLKDMALVRAEPLGAQREGVQQIIRSILAQDNRSITNYAGQQVSREKFFHHPYGRDPATGGRLPPGVTVDIYYVPANYKEYCSYDVVDRSVGLFSGRQRLAVRTENGKVAFYKTSHPR